MNGATLYEALKNHHLQAVLHHHRRHRHARQRVLYLHRAVHHLRRVPGAHRHRQLLHQLCQPSGWLVQPAARRRWRSSRSALCGMVSGSSVGNTVTTGSVHHPHDEEDRLQARVRRRGRGRRLHRRPDHAPHHGRGGLPDGRVHEACPTRRWPSRPSCPRVLYFTGIFIAVHLEAKKLGLKGMPQRGAA